MNMREFIQWSLIHADVKVYVDPDQIIKCAVNNWDAIEKKYKDLQKARLNDPS